MSNLEAQPQSTIKRAKPAPNFSVLNSLRDIPHASQGNSKDEIDCHRCSSLSFLPISEKNTPSVLALSYLLLIFAPIPSRSGGVGRTLS